MFVGLVVAFAIGTAVDVYRVQRDLRNGQDLLSDLDLHTVDELGGLDQVAAKASRELDAADRVAHDSPFLSVLGVVPGLRTQVDGLRDLTRASSAIGHLGSTAAANINVAIEQTKTGGPSSRIVLVDTVLSEIATLRTGLDGIEVGAGGTLVPPLNGARARLVDKLAEADGRLDDATKVSTALRGFLAGPRKYLVLGGNNAEMRALGVPTTAGTAVISNGEVKVSEFLPTHKVDLDFPGVDVPPEIAHLYGWLGPGQAYTSAVMTPDFPEAAEISSRISPRNPIGPIDGVIYVDTVTLQSLLGVIGPVEVDGITYDQTTAASELINKAYQRFQTSADSAERRDAQGNVAQAIFDAINTRSFSITRLAAVLSDAAEGRHLLAWSANPDEQVLWEKVGADGATAPNDIVITSQDLGGSKLDYYVKMAAAATVESHDDHIRVKLDLTIANPAKEAISPYIAGNSVYANPGEYGSFVTLSLPKSAYAIDNPEGLAMMGPDGPLQVVTTVVRVPDGQNVVQHFEFSLPKEDSMLRVVPSGRLNPVYWNLNRLEFFDTKAVTVDLDHLPTHIGADHDMWLLGFGLALLLAACALALSAGYGRTHGHEAQSIHADVTVGWWLAAIGTSMLIAQIALNLVT